MVLKVGVMKNLTIKNVPDDLHARLKNQARLNHRSLNSEILHRLAQTSPNEEFDPVREEELLRQVRELHKRWKGPPLTIDEIEAAINEGRM